MPGYKPGKPIEEVQRELGLTDVVKLASNENPLGPSPQAVAAVMSAVGAMNIYPDAGGHALKTKLASRFGVSFENVMLGNGSDEILDVLGHMFLSGPSDKIVFPWPSFLRYPLMGTLSEAQTVRVPLTDSWEVDVDAMIDAMDESVRLVVLANPNNPTGRLTKSADVARLLDAIPVGAVLVMDEAYYEFAVGVDGYPDTLAWLRSGRPVVAVRTFSKSFGLAGVRIGYAFAPTEVAEAFQRVREPFSVNALALAAGLAALDDDEHLRATLAINQAGRDRIVSWMSAKGFATIESHANFVCVEVPGSSEKFADALLREGVIVRSGHLLGMPRHLRVSIGTVAEIERFLVAFERVVSLVAAS